MALDGGVECRIETNNILPKFGEGCRQMAKVTLQDVVLVGEDID